VAVVATAGVVAAVSVLDLGLFEPSALALCLRMRTGWLPGGRTVLLVDDIVDSGHSLTYATVLAEASKKTKREKQ
jgi:hypothetical protein